MFFNCFITSKKSLSLALEMALAWNFIIILIVIGRVKVSV